jgi:hypothetical protein
MVGLRPSYSAHVPWGERGAPVMHVEDSGIPHLAKNERDVGHPSFVEGTLYKEASLFKSAARSR